MELKNKIKKIDKNIIALVLFISFWFSLLFLTGALTSGYHFTDDHEIITINKNVHDNGLVNAAKSIIKDDLKIRFRSFYYLNRAVLTKLFHTNFLYWSIYNGILSILTSYFLFLFLYRQGYRFINALLFPFLTLVGAQSSIWWSLGPAETIGFFLLSASLFFLVNSIFRKKNYQLIISIFFLFLSSLSKESFTLFIPAYILLLLWFKHEGESNKTFFDIIRSNLILIGILLLMLLSEVYLIIFVVGTNKIGYAGIDNSFSVISFFKSVYYFLRHNKYVYLSLFGLFILLQNIKSWKMNTLYFKKIRTYIYSIAILFAIILPQFVLYNKSGISGRYLLPFNFGFSFFVIHLLENCFANKEISFFSKRVFFIFAIWVIFSFFKNDTLPYVKSYAEEGELTNKFLSSIVDNTKSNDSILVVLNGYENYEWGFSISLYLSIEANRKNINFYSIKTSLNDDFAKSLDKGFSKAFNAVLVKEVNNNFSCIAILPFSINNEIKSRLDSNYVYQRRDFDSFTVYNKK